jgi:uncharacterized protein (TIRG00374 family)
MPMKRWQSLLLGLVISAAALYVALRGAQLNRVAEALGSARYGFALLALAIVTASTYARGLRWSAVVRGRLSPTRGFWLFNAGFLFNNVLPLRLGEVVRAYLAARQPPLRFAEALSSIVVERLLDMLSLVAILAVLLQLPELAVPRWAASAGLLMLVGSLAGMVALYLAARFPAWVARTAGRLVERFPLPERFTAESVGGQLESFLDGLVSLRDFRAFSLAVAYSALAWLMSGLAGWVLLFAFAEFGRPGLEIGFLAIAGAGLGIAVPSLPGAVGPFEAAVKLALVAVGYAQEPALSYALVLHGINFVTTSVLGAIGLLREGLTFGEVASAARELGKAHPEETESVTA